MQELFSRIEPTIDEWMLLIPVFFVGLVGLVSCLLLMKALVDNFFKKHPRQRS